jgi:hypothetical protein
MDCTVSWLQSPHPLMSQSSAALCTMPRNTYIIHIDTESAESAFSLVHFSTSSAVQCRVSGAALIYNYTGIIWLYVKVHSAKQTGIRRDHMDHVDDVSAQARAEADQSAHCKECDLTISTKPRKKDVRWPLDKDGNPVEVVACPICGDKMSGEAISYEDLPPEFYPRDLVVAAAILHAAVGYTVEEAADKAVKLLCALDKLTPYSF